MTNHFMKIALSAAAAATLSACGGTTIGGGGGDPFVEPIRDEDDVNKYAGNYDIADDRRATPDLTLLPVGTFDYSGRFRTDLDVEGDTSVDGLYGNIAIRAELLGAGDSVNGELFNIHTTNGSTPVEKLEGALTLAGTLNDYTKSMTSSITGTLTGHMGNDGETGELNFNGRLAGHTRDRQTGTVPIIGTPIYTGGIAQSITGSVTGSVSGSESATFIGSFYVNK